MEALHAEHHRLDNLDPDPLIFARGFTDPNEGEVAALIAAGFAYGRVEQIVKTLGAIFTVLGKTPRTKILETDAREWLDLYEGFFYRFHKAPDLALLLWLIRQALEKHGTLKALFTSSGASTTGEKLTAFCDTILDGDPRPILSSSQLPPRHPVRYLFSSPGKGGAAKRMCLFLRWMIRKDQLDPGYWQGAMDPADLIVPLDTHVAKVGKTYGMTTRKSSDWKTAVEITAALKKYDETDPLRYDFSLFRFGMSGKLPD